MPAPIAMPTLLLGLCSLLPVIARCQNKAVSCKEIHRGTFYCYPKNSSDQLMERMDGRYEHDRNLKTGDTMLYHVKWGKDCSFSEKYVTGNTKMATGTREMLEKNTFVFHVTNMTKDYYTFMMYAARAPDVPLGDDTIWFAPKAHPTNSPCFVYIPNSFALRRQHFRDTSRYAVLYLYRPGKFTNFLNFYPVYLDGIEACVAQNNTGYMFKILKEGPLKIRATLLDHDTYLTVPIRFGHSYYIRTKVHFGAGTKKGTYTEMQAVDESDGKRGFSDVKLRS